MKWCLKIDRRSLPEYLALALIAPLLVIIAMVDFCLTSPQVLAVHVGVFITICALAYFLPWTAKMAKVAKATRRFLRALPLALLLAFIAVVAHANITAIWSSRGRIFTNASNIPSTKIGLVFGTSDLVNGRENLYFRYRIEAATIAWQAGKLETLIVSGDNRSRYYNEPEKMKQALIKRGIPENRIVCDYAGLRTLDSVVRAKEIFDADPILFISQRFQNERAIYLAKANGIEAYGFDARDVQTQAGLKTKLREVGARVKMWLDVNFLDTRPKHLGEKVEMPE
jgi:SanA protein